MPFEDIREIAELVGGGTTIIPTQSLPTDEEIAALEERLHVRFPEDYKAFLRLVGSLLVEVREDIWPRSGAGAVGPHWQQTRYELDVYGFCAEVEWLRIEVETKAFRAEHGLELAPVFAWANTSDRICFTPTGSLVEWSRHREAPAPLDESFEEVFRRLIGEQREYKEELLGEE